MQAFAGAGGPIKGDVRKSPGEALVGCGRLARRPQPAQRAGEPTASSPLEGIVLRVPFAGPAQPIDARETLQDAARRCKTLRTTPKLKPPKSTAGSPQLSTNHHPPRTSACMAPPGTLSSALPTS